LSTIFSYAYISKYFGYEWVHKSPNLEYVDAITQMN